MSRRRGNPPAAGFTLLELLVVTILMLAIAALVMPEFSRSMEGFRLQKAVREAAAVLKEARNTAVTEGRSMHLQVAAEEGMIISSDGDVRFPLPEGIRIAMQPSNADPYAGNVSEVVFHADGSTSGAVLSVASSVDAYFIGVDWITGQIDVRH